MKKVNIAKQLTVSVVAVIVASVSLLITTFAITYSIVSVKSNLFATAILDINLNDGKPIINEGEVLFAPGIEVKKDFFIENTGTCDVYYRLYFDKINGELADVLEVKICYGDKVLYEGIPSSLVRENVSAADDILHPADKRELQIYFIFPENAGNSAQGQTLSFDFAADAVQVRNNKDKSFENENNEETSEVTSEVTDE